MINIVNVVSRPLLAFKRILEILKLCKDNSRIKKDKLRRMH